MKGRIMSFVMILVMLLVNFSSLSGLKKADEQLLKAEEMIYSLLKADCGEENDFVVSHCIKGLNDAEDYILVVGNNLGYGILAREDLSLIEYSPYSKSPYENISKDNAYYAGPANYFRRENGKIENIMTKKTISANARVELANKVKDKAVRNKARFDVEEDILSSTDLNIEMASSVGVGGVEAKDPEKYMIVNKKLISDYQYFLCGPYHGENETGTCTTVATQLLLSYNNWSKYARLIENPIYKNNPNLINNQVTEPYNIDFISTNSYNDSDGIIESFYEYLLSVIDPNEQFATLNMAKSGIDQYLATLGNIINGVTFDYNATLFSVNTPEIIVQEINANRPLLVGINYYRNENDFILEKVHTVVVYGYQTFKINNQNVEGYICHLGWNHDSTNSRYNYAWFDKEWLFGGHLYFRVNHVHTDVNRSNNVHIIDCITCGRVSTTNNHVYTDFEPKYIYDFSNYGNDVLDKTYHWSICNCGYKEKKKHDKMYENLDGERHSIRCKQCYTFIGEDNHLYKHGGSCYYCGGFS